MAAYESQPEERHWQSCQSAEWAFLHAEMERSSSSIRHGSNPLAKSLRGRRRLSGPVSATAVSSGGVTAARAAAGGGLADAAERDAFERGQVPACGRTVAAWKRRESCRGKWSGVCVCVGGTRRSKGSGCGWNLPTFQLLLHTFGFNWRVTNLHRFLSGSRLHLS